MPAQKTLDMLRRRVLVKGSKIEDFNTDLPAGTPSIQQQKKEPTLRSISNLIVISLNHRLLTYSMKMSHSHVFGIG